MLHINNFLSEEQLSELLSCLSSAQYVEGKTMAGWYASTVKENMQCDPNDPAYATANGMIHKSLRENVVFQEYSFPLMSSDIIFSRYEPGMSYGDHVDTAMMRIRGSFIRTDISFTIFLSEKESYTGGELVVNSMGNEVSIKGNRGDMILYASDSLHRVQPITNGCREVAVGWIQSMVRSSEQRQILFDLSEARRKIFATHGKTEELDLIAKTLTNLKRMWGTP